MRKKSEMWSHQNRLATRLYESHGHMAVADMGSGKTTAALTAVAELLADGEIRHGLVLAPRRVTHLVWPAEIEAWDHTHYLRYQLLTGSPAQRVKQLAMVEKPFVDLSIVGIDNTQWLVETIEKYPDWHPIFDLLIVDEISRFRNQKGKQAKALKSIVGRFRNIWGLTGTPRPNGYLDLFTPLSLVSKGEIWGRSFYDWRKKNFFPLDWERHDWVPFPDKVETIQREAAAWTSIISDEDMPDLPELVIVPHWVELPPDARAAYKTMERQLFAKVRREAIAAGHGDAELATILAASKGVASGKLSQIANGFLYEEVDGIRGAIHLHAAKSEWIQEAVDNLNGAPAICVYEFKQDLAVMKQLFGDGLPTIGGEVSEQQAAANVEAWNRGELPLLALHAASGGHGLNLQFGGSQILWMGLTWSAELWAQTIKRIHRPGQDKRCFVHLCLARDTIDEVKRSRVVEKLSAEEAFRRYLQTRPEAAAA